MKSPRCLTVLALVITAAHADDRVSLPENYRDSFVEYLSLDRVQNHDQFIRLFANKIALRGPDKNGELGSGAVLVGEVYSVRKDADGAVLTSRLNRRIKDKLLLIAVMEKQDQFGDKPRSEINVGDWDFAAYKPDGSSANKSLDDCRACHQPLSDSDFVFSLKHLPQGMTH